MTICLYQIMAKNENVCIVKAKNGSFGRVARFAVEYL